MTSEEVKKLNEWVRGLSREEKDRLLEELKKDKENTIKKYLAKLK